MERFRYLESNEIHKDCEFSGMEEMNHVHVRYGAFAVCGLAEDDQPTMIVKEKIDCPRCISMIMFCKSIHYSKIKK